MKTNSDNKTKFLQKFDQPTKPVMTQVVPVEEKKTVQEKPTKATGGERDHFNVYLTKKAGKALRMHKLNTGVAVQDILERIVIDYLISQGELPSSEKL